MSLKLWKVQEQGVFLLWKETVMLEFSFDLSIQSSVYNFCFIFFF